MTKRGLFTPPAYVLCGKVMFLVVSVYLLTGGPHVIGHTWDRPISTWNPLLDMLKLIVKCFIALRLKGLLVTAHQWSGQGNVFSHVCLSVCLFTGGPHHTGSTPLPHGDSTVPGNPSNPYHMGPLLDLLKPIAGCLACKCSGEGNVFTHICLSDCLFTGSSPSYRVPALHPHPPNCTGPSLPSLKNNVQMYSACTGIPSSGPTCSNLFTM